MNILKLLDKLSDDQFFSTEATRLQTITKISSFGKKAAVAAVPLGLGTLLSTPAKAAETETSASSSFLKSTLTDALQLALVLEYLENEYYAIGLSTCLLYTSPSPRD